MRRNNRLFQQNRSLADVTHFNRDVRTYPPIADIRSNALYFKKTPAGAGAVFQ
jgi:hypothetical protein